MFIDIVYGRILLTVFQLAKIFLKLFLSEKNVLLYTTFGRNLGSWAGRLRMNRLEGKPATPIHHLFYSFVK